MTKIKALLCDSDGTLVDTPRLIRHGQFEASTTYLREHGVPEGDIPDYETYEGFLHQVVGGATHDTIKATVQLLYQDRPHYLENIDFKELYSLLDPIQDRIAPEYVRGYPGLEDMLFSLGSAGIKMAIFSSGNSRMIVRNLGYALPKIGLSELYKDAHTPNEEKLATFVTAVRDTYRLPDFAVITSDHTTEHKPHPQGLEMCMERLNVTPDVSAVIGDHTYDMFAAKAAKVAMRIGVTHGFDDQATLEAAGATHIVHKLSEVPMVLAA